MNKVITKHYHLKYRLESLALNLKNMFWHGLSYLQNTLHDKYFQYYLQHQSQHCSLDKFCFFVHLSPSVA